MRPGPTGPAPIRLRAPGAGEAVGVLVVTGAHSLADGGLLVLVTSSGGVVVDDDSSWCPDTRYALARIEPSGVRWATCLRTSSYAPILAVAGEDVWIAFNRELDATDDVLTRLARYDLASGRQVFERVVVRSAPNLTPPRATDGPPVSAVAALGDGGLLVHAVATDAVIEQGSLQVRSHAPGARSYLLELDHEARITREVLELEHIHLRQLTAAGRRFAANGVCQSSGRPTIAGAPLANCAYSVILAGDLEESRPPWIRTFARDASVSDVAIAADGELAAGGSGRRASSIDGVTLDGTCSDGGWAARWSPRGSLRFATALGDCTATRSGPGRGSSPPYTWVKAVMLDGERTRLGMMLGTYGAPAETVGLGARWVSTRRGVDAALVSLDGTGTITDARVSSFAGDERTADITVGAQVLDLAGTGGRGWLVVTHRGPMRVGETSLPTRAHTTGSPARCPEGPLPAGRGSPWRMPKKEPCTKVVHHELATVLVPWDAAF